MAERRGGAKQGIFPALAALSFLVVSGYAVLWRESNRDLRILGVALALFFIGVALSPRRDIAVGGSFFFAGIRWGVGALLTGDPRAIGATVGFLAIPITMAVLDIRRRKNSPRTID